MKLPSARNDYGSFWGFAFALIVSLFFVIGCGGGGGGGGDVAAEPSVPAGSPKIASDISAIDFGNQVMGQMTERELTLWNSGNANLDIGAVSDPGAPFAVAGDCANTTLAPDKTCKVLVRFTPGAQQVYTGSFRVDSNAGNLPFSLTGTGKELSVGITSITTTCTGTDSTVKVKVVVSDSNKAPVTLLTEGNFKINLNDKLVVPIPSSFSSITIDEPVSVALALDWSNSFYSFKDEIEKSAKEFINSSLKPEDNAAIFKFASAIGAEQPYLNVGDDREKLMAAVEADFSKTISMSGTMIWDAVDHVVQLTGDEENHKRAVILLTDGYDSGSAVSLQDLIKHAVDNNVVVFTIGLGTVNEGVLEQLAQGTGGIHFNALTTDSLSDSLNGIYQKINFLLTNQYEFVLTNPSPATANLLKVAVEVSGKKGEGAREVPSCP